MFPYLTEIFPYVCYLIYLLTAIGLSPGGSSTVHIYTQTVQYSTHLHTNSTVQYTFTHKQYSTVYIYTQTVQYSTVHIYTHTVQYTFTYTQYSIVHIYTQTVQYSTHLHTSSTVQYTLTHKQYTEGHKTNNTQNNTTIWKSAGRALSWVDLP